jgi:hypothetical protein
MDTSASASGRMVKDKARARSERFLSGMMQISSVSDGLRRIASAE